MARAYLGLSVPGFPNMFLLYGPNTNGGSGSVVNTLECGIGHVLAALREMEREPRRAGSRSRREAAERFDRELRAALAKTVWQSGCSNWYVDENGNDPSNWPWLWSAYRRRTERLEPGAYELSRARCAGRVGRPRLGSRAMSEAAPSGERRRSRRRTSAPSSAAASPATSASSRSRSRTLSPAAGSSSTNATCIPAATSTAASGPRSATPSPLGRPSATSRRNTTSRRSS